MEVVRKFVYFEIIILPCISILTEAVAQRCYVKNVFLEISQNSQENTCARVSVLIKLQASGLHFIKIETLGQVFSVNFAKFLRTPFLKKNLRGTAQTFRIEQLFVKTIFHALFVSETFVTKLSTLVVVLY